MTVLFLIGTSYNLFHFLKNYNIVNNINNCFFLILPAQEVFIFKTRTTLLGFKTQTSKLYFLVEKFVPQNAILL